MSVSVMATGYTCIRHFLCFINLLFWILGSCVLGVGVWLSISYETYARILPSYHILSADNLAIIVGCLTFFVAFCGCCGSWFQNKCLLTTYLVSIVVLMILEISVGTLSFAFRRQLTNTLREELLDGIRNKYVLNDTKGILETWDQIQVNFNCCGVNNYTDWYSINAWPDKEWVPNTCCIPTLPSNESIWYELEDNDNEDQCGKHPETDITRYRRHGCYYKIRHFVLNNLHVVGLTSIGVAFIQFFAIVAALLIVCTMDYKKRNRSVFNHNSRPTYNRVPTL
ncbi:tetraspanin-9-like [Oppia nitens]|uniref:tetraspanin-9-like n=1 Tax=Oppia nitens TaxID=1686743 RepID=UPI0023DB2B4B|nr:tetraspanin-9-like [Oppia nitens]